LHSVIEILQTFLCFGTSLVTSGIESFGDLRFESFSNVHTRKRLELVGRSFSSKLCDLILLHRNSLFDLFNRAFVWNRITDTNTEAVVKKPVVNNSLATIEECHGCIRTQFVEYNVDNTTASCSNVLLRQETKHQLSTSHQKAIVFKWRILMSIIRHMQVDDLRNNHADNLFSSPSRTGLDNGWLGDYTIPFRNPKQDVHQLLLCQEHISPTHLVHTSQCILHDTHERTISLRRNDIERNHAELHDLSSSLLCLRNVQVHLVAIEIGVVRRSDGQVQSESRIRHDPNSVTHHRFFVQ
jgi:hypothetical protein